MTPRIILGFAALGCVLLSSCYPYNENPGRKLPDNKPAEKTVTAAEQQQIKEQRDKLKAEENLKKTPDALTGPVEPSGGQTTPSGELPKPPTEQKRDFDFATKVPGKDGFVISPYNGKVVDVRDIPTGTLVQDPTYPAAEKKYFRVP